MRAPSFFNPFPPPRHPAAESTPERYSAGIIRHESMVWVREEKEIGNLAYDGKHIVEESISDFFVREPQGVKS